MRRDVLITEASSRSRGKEDVISWAIAKIDDFTIDAELVSLHVEGPVTYVTVQLAAFAAP